MMPESFTLRIIFYGLIAFSPNADDSGTLALLVDGRAACMELEPSADCSGSAHLPMIFLLDGDCVDGDCVRGISGKGLPFNLLWVLERERVHIEGLTSTPGPASSDPPDESFPSSSGTARHRGWQARMSRLGFAVKPDCRRGDASCALSATFAIPGSDSDRITCHLFHAPMSEKCEDLQLEVKEFEFREPDCGEGQADTYRQALADATMTEVDVTSSSIELATGNLTDGSGSHSATIRPIQVGNEWVVTLVVGNFGLLAEDDEAVLESGIVHHFELFYALGQADGGSRRLVPCATGSWRCLQKKFLDCEDDMDRMRTGLLNLAGLPELHLVPPSVPHNVEECVGTQFQ
jgi:hypothetical protein